MSKAEVRPSCVHGRGVFATQHIYVGERICIYDGDIVKQDINDSVDPYLIDFDKENNLMMKGYSEPRSLVGIGQLVNDAASFVWDEKNTFDTLVDKSIDYIEQSIKMCNCSPYKIGNKLYIVAMRDISKDEELFMSYSVKFWLVSHRTPTELSYMVASFMEKLISFLCGIAAMYSVVDKESYATDDYHINHYIYHYAVVKILRKYYNKNKNQIKVTPILGKNKYLIQLVDIPELQQAEEVSKFVRTTLLALPVDPSGVNNFREKTYAEIERCIETKEETCVVFISWMYNKLDFLKNNTSVMYILTAKEIKHPVGLEAVRVLDTIIDTLSKKHRVSIIHMYHNRGYRIKVRYS